MIDVIGYCAAILTTIAFAPQFIKAWRSRSTTDISLGMFLVLVAGVMLWIVYGVFVQNGPLIVANTATIILAGGILLLKLKYK